MEYDPKDNELIHLLKKLKDSNGAYPPEMLALRRQGFLKQVAAISAGAGLAMSLRNTIKSGKGASLSSAAGKVVETLLVVAIVAEAGAVTYFYRHKLTEVFNSVRNSPRAEAVASPPVLPSPLAEMEFTSSPVATVTVSKTATLTATPESTPSPQLAVEATEQNNNSGPTTSNTGNTGSGDPGSQSEPTESPNTNNGNHYGQTPKPERTIQPGNEVSNSNLQQNNTNPRRKH